LRREVSESKVPLAYEKKTRNGVNKNNEKRRMRSKMKY
jgi:hypothetical protein